MSTCSHAECIFFIILDYVLIHVFPDMTFPLFPKYFHIYPFNGNTFWTILWFSGLVCSQTGNGGVNDPTACRHKGGSRKADLIT